MIEIVGFTGTREGMTLEQRLAIQEWLEHTKRWADLEIHHGDCIGADAEFHRLGRDLGAWCVGHPPKDSSKRAWCEFDEERSPLPYLARNRAIVDESRTLLAAPKGFHNELRSGTWSTIRYAGPQEDKEVWVVFPDGSMEEWDLLTL